jgi:hypothetical protein
MRDEEFFFMLQAVGVLCFEVLLLIDLLHFRSYKRERMNPLSLDRSSLRGVGSSARREEGRKVSRGRRRRRERGRGR